jgi:hypothetical protein
MIYRSGINRDVENQFRWDLGIDATYVSVPVKNSVPPCHGLLQGYRKRRA